MSNNANEMVREARGLHADWVVFESMHHGGGQGAKSDDGEAERKFMLWLANEFPAMCDALEKAQAEIGRLREAQRWIPVSERLPEAYIPVLVHRVHSYCDNDGYSDIRITARTNVINGCVADWMETGYAYIVTHWMPLPAAPEEGAEK